MPLGNLPAAAKTVWERVYEQAKKDGKDESAAAQIAWGAVRNAGWKKDKDGEWIKDKSFVEFSMVVTKASYNKETKERRIRMSASDTGFDVFGERMSTQLFHNFVRRIKEGAPEKFKSALIERSGWSGGMPYASVSHYRSGAETKNVPADIISVYVDGDVLKSVAVARDTPLGNAVWNSLKADLDGTSKYEQKIRVSIGFLDLQHSHGDFVFTRDSLEKRCPMCDNGVENKVYLDGVLVHEAFTRVPANPRTSAEVEKMADNIKTRADDAESIVGEELAKELEVNKSTAVEDLLVVKSDEPAAIEEKAAPMVDDEEDMEDHPADCTCKACASKKKEKSEVAAVEKTELDVAVDNLKARILQVKSLPREEALQQLQSDFELVAKAVQNEFPETPKPAPVIASIDPQLSELLAQIKSAVDNMAAKVGTVEEQVAILKTQVERPAIQSAGAPAPRALQVERTAVPQKPDGNKPMRISELAKISVGLSQ